MSAWERAIRQIRECRECGERVRYYVDGKGQPLFDEELKVRIYCPSCGHETVRMVTELTHLQRGKRF